MIEVKQLLFARWIITCYDNDILNNEDGYWWKNQLEHFNTTVYPNYEKNGSVHNAESFLIESKLINDALNDLP